MEIASTQLVEPAASRRSRRAGAVLRLAGSAALVAFIFHRVDWPVLRNLFGSLSWKWWLAALTIYFGAQCASAYRWHRLARRVGLHESFRRCLQLYFEAMFFGLCLPSSIGGDVWKAWRLPRAPEGRLLAGCTVFADRLAGLMALLVIGLSALASRSFGLSAAESAGLVAAGFLTALAVSYAGLRMLTWLERWFSNRPRIGKLLFKLLPLANHPRTAWEAIGWSMVVQALNVTMGMALGRVLGLSLPLGAYAFAVPLVALATVAPISFNGVGVREGGLAWLLAADGVSQELGLAMGLLWSLVNTTVGLAGGLVYLCGRHAAQPARDPQPADNVDRKSPAPMARSEGEAFLGQRRLA